MSARRANSEKPSRRKQRLFDYSPNLFCLEQPHIIIALISPHTVALLAQIGEREDGDLTEQLEQCVV